MIYDWVVYLHVLSVLFLIAAHGVAISVSFRIGSAGTREAVIALLGVSEASLMSMYIALGASVLSGIAAGIMGDYWHSGWFWASLVVLVAMVAGMVPLGAMPFGNIRRFAGVERTIQGKRLPAEPADEARMTAEIARLRPDILAIIGLGGLALVLWLMMFKPF